MMWLFRITMICILLLASQVQAGIVVIVNPNNDLQKFSQRQLVDLYMGRNLYFPNGELALRLDHPPDSPIRAEFYQGLVGKSVSEVSAYWARLLFTGRASPPQVIQDSESVLNIVRNNNNAIGYIEENELDDTVKVIGRVD